MTSQAKVFVSLKFPGDAVEQLRTKVSVSANDSSDPVSHEELLRQLKDKDGCLVMLRDIFAEPDFAKLPDLKVVANVAVGYDNIDVAAANNHGVLIVNTPGVLDDATADFAMALLLACTRRIVEADRYVREGSWKQWSFTTLLGTDLSGKTAGIVGLGRIGRAFARRARGFGMHIVYAQRNRASAAVESELGAAHLPLESLLRESDFVSLHCPLNAETHHLIGGKELSMMKQTSFIVNTARGAIIDEPALIEALARGTIKGAGLDVFENEPLLSSPLIDMPNVVLAPHIGSGSYETRAGMATLAAEGLVSALNGRRPHNTVNPEIWPVFLSRLAQSVP